MIAWPRLLMLFKTPWIHRGMLSALLGCLLPTLQAQTLRDPTLAPADLQTSAVATSIHPGLSLDTTPPVILVREGRRYVVLGLHLYAAGQSLGGLKVERIEETEVWFRKHQILYKVPLYPPNLQRSVATPVPHSGPMPISPAMLQLPLAAKPALK